MSYISRKILKYPLNEERVKDIILILLDRCKRLYNNKCSVELTWMSPKQFLSKVPHPALPVSLGAPASLCLSEKYYDKTSIEQIEKAIKSGKKLDPLYLDYSNMRNKFPDHEGRHRAFVAYKLGIDKIPVIVVKLNQ